MGEFAGKNSRTDMNSSRATGTTQPTVGKRTLVEQAYAGMPQPMQARNTTGAPAPGAQPAANPGAVGPSVVELGDQEIGTQTFHEALVWNLETIEANVVARVDGDAAVQLVAAPGRIFPSRELANADAKEIKFRLVFSPTKRGRISATLRVQLDWRADARKPLELAIPVRGAAHATGTPTIDETVAQEEHLAQQQREAMERSSDEKRREAREDEDWKTHRVHGDEHSREALEAATVGARIALDSLFQNRIAGVETAKDEAKNYVQGHPRHEESLLASLAMAGLEIATAGIAGAIAKRLEGPLEKLLTTVTQPHLNPARVAVAESTDVPAKHVVALLLDGIKQSVKTIEKGIHQANAGEHGTQGRAAAGETERSGIPPLSADPLIAFFGSEKIALSSDHAVQAHRVSIRTKDELAPLLDLPGDAPRNAVRAMDKVTEEITSMNQDKEAAALQAQASALHWMRYLAQASLGAIYPQAAAAGTKNLDSHGRPLSDMSNVNIRPASGLIDLLFAASAAHPETPATLRSVFVQGVSNVMARRLVQQSLLDAGLAVRAHGTPADGDASLPVTVTRDEAGNIDYADQTRPPGVPGASWLARKAGDLHGGRSAELRGARKLVEEELMSKPVPSALIATDSTDGIPNDGR
jgi:hypothetical protein